MSGAIVYFLVIDIVILLVLITFKTIYFKRATNRKTFSRWLYFSQHSVINSSKPGARKFKRIENVLSFVLFAVVAISLIVFYLMNR